MPTVRKTRTIAAPVQELWETIRDPHHLPRWWPRVERVEDVADGAFTEVMRTGKGKVVRADFKIVRLDEHSHVIAWEQQLKDTPFENLLRSAETEIRLAALPAAGGDDVAVTEVTLQLHQTLTESVSRGRYKSWLSIGGSAFRGFGNHMMQRAGNDTLAQAITGLQRISGRA